MLGLKLTHVDKQGPRWSQEALETVMLTASSTFGDDWL